jgi:tRNA (guanine37-N1)-methyltransferase
VKIDIVSIFPEYFAPLDLSLIGRARAAGRLRVAVHDLRTWTHDVHRTVDDTPYGGGPGMVMRPARRSMRWVPGAPDSSFPRRPASRSRRRRRRRSLPSRT